MVNKEVKQKMKCYFMIINLVFAIFAFGGMIGFVSAAGCGTDADGNTVCTPTPPGGTNTPTPGRDAGNAGDVDLGSTDNSGSNANTNADNEGAEFGDGADTGGGNNNGGAGNNNNNLGNSGNNNRNNNFGNAGNGNSAWGPLNIFGILNNENIQKMVWYGGIGAGIFGTIGGLAGGDDGMQWGALAGAIGGAVTGLAEKQLGTGPAALLGLGVAGLIFIMTYSKASQEITEFYCMPWQAPIGGEYCELCNKYEDCTEYTCKSLGQACAIINQGTEEQKCVWQNPGDVKSPIITFEEVSEGHSYKPDTAIRPPATGVKINPDGKECIRAFFPLEFEFSTNEPAQCKIDYNLTTTYDNMEFYVNGNSLFIYNHTEILSLPGPEAMNAENPELKNDGHYRLFVRCIDANGNFNQDAFSVSFCVDPGPDVTPPFIVNTNIPTGNPVQFNQSSFDLEVYVNEPSECKWSRVNDQSYENMEEVMNCDTHVWQMNNRNVYTCRTTLTGIQDRIDNDYYFRCKDQPLAEEGDRNTNSQGYHYVLVGTQPLNILSVGPNETIRGSANVIPVYLTIQTDNGHENGNALCYYYNSEDGNPPSNEGRYVLFHETQANQHTQRQDLITGNYDYFFKCVDLGGNAVYTSTSFQVETDREPPIIVRAYKDVQLTIITNEEAICTYSNTDCNFEIDSGIEMGTSNDLMHTANWVVNRNHYIRCKDGYENQPNPNTCSIILRPSENTVQGTDDSGWFDI